MPIRDTSKLLAAFFCLSRISDFLPSPSPFHVFCCGLSSFSLSLPPLDQESAALGANFSDDGCIISFPLGRVGFFSLYLCSLLHHGIATLASPGNYTGGRSRWREVRSRHSALLWPFVTHVIYTSLLALTGLPLSVLTPAVAVSKSNAKKGKRVSSSSARFLFARDITPVKHRTRRLI